jgi:2,3-bisphosphoglycerate-independent phosphoglycerate mutase
MKKDGWLIISDRIAKKPLLNKKGKPMTQQKKAVLLILDGWGINHNAHQSAIEAAKPATFNNFLAQYPNSQLQASGQFVGLPAGVMGNSEVGHENIGAGRVLKQKLTLISDCIENGSFCTNPALKGIIERVKSKPGSTLHLIGLLSEGDVHSHIGHLNALISWAERENLAFFVHPVLDGRDDPPKNSLHLLKDLTERLNKGKIGSVCGRYWAMDRDNNWSRVEKYWNLLINNEGLLSKSPIDAVQEAYTRGDLGTYTPAEDSDEFIQPTCFEGLDSRLKDGDAVIFFNFRPDRAREISLALTQNKFEHFARAPFPKLDYVCLTYYSQTLHEASAGAEPVVAVAFTEANFPKQDRTLSLGEYVSQKGLKQLRVAETEKFRHVTSFFNQGGETPFVGEDRILVPSPKVATYDLQPEMSVFGIASAMVENINLAKYDLIVANFANPDMVGHSGDFAATMKAVQFTDQAIKMVADACLANGVALLITADHGNADQKINPDGSVRTAHSTNPVPCILVSNEYKGTKLQDGALCDLAPTILKLMNLEKPGQMTGKSLI